MFDYCVLNIKMLKCLTASSKYGTGVYDVDGTKEYSLMGLDDSHW